MAYSEGELTVMLRDAALALEAGAGGLVVGILTPEGAVEVRRCRRFMDTLQVSRRVDCVFHRAFDVTLDPRQALEQLIDLGITRVLTSGRAARAPDGTAEIRRAIEQAAGRIQVLPGGGIRADTVRQLVAATGADQVHLSVTAPARDVSAAANPEVRFGVDPPPTELEFRAVEEAAVRRVRTLLDQA
jgi:copper homeostasis protein